MISWRQLAHLRTDTNRRATMLHLQEIDRRLRPAWTLNGARDVQANILGCYRRECELSPAALDYLSLLNALDLAAYSAQQGVCDRELLDAHLRTLMTSETVSLTFLKKLQECCADPSIYEHLTAELVRHGAIRRQPNRKPPPTRTDG